MTVIPGIHTAFDLETAEGMWDYGPEFIRLIGHATGPFVRQTADVNELLRVLRASETVTGHNICGFDLVALAYWHGLDFWELIDRNAVRDTMLIAFLADPPPARMNGGQIDRYYSLNEVGDRLLGERKHGDLKKLAKAFGGYDAIPLWDPRYIAYLDQDVVLTRDIADYLTGPDRKLDDYALREHHISALGMQVSLNGFRVDVQEVSRRVTAGNKKRQEILTRLTRDYGLPTRRKDGGLSKSPQNTQEGREALKRAFADAGAPHMPKTPTGAWATGREAMDRMIDYYGPKGLTEVVEIAQTIQALNGVRTVYETVYDNMVEDRVTGDWRVHPSVSARQASGRLSITKPGLTVMGKRGGRHVEREIFLPEEGEVIVTADLSQIDARAVAALSQDRAYMAMFEPGKDLHAEVAMRVFGTTKMREQAKVAGHGWNYGLGVDGMVKQMGIDRKVAVTFAQSMRDQFPRLVEWRSEMAEIAASGRLLDNGFGRRMRPDPARAYTQGPALMGQGCARDLMMEGALRLPRDIMPMLRGFVHDEIVLSVPIEHVDEVEKIVVESMSFSWVRPGMPNARPIEIIADVGKRGKTWGDCYAGK